MTTTSHPTRASLLAAGRHASVARIVSGLLRLSAAAAIVAAIVTQVSDRLAHGVFEPEKYFSYFTVQSSLINIVVLAVGGALALRLRRDPELFTAVRMSTVAYAAVTCVVYNLLLRDLPHDGFVGVSWPNEIMHVVIPVFIIIEWVAAPGRAVLGWGRVWLTVSYPLAWLAFTLVRGVLTLWYPYPFLDPDGAAGPVTVIGYVVVISVFIVATSFIAIGISRITTANLGPENIRRENEARSAP